MTPKISGMRQALQALVLIVTGSIYRRGYSAAQEDIAGRIDERIDETLGSIYDGSACRDQQAKDAIRYWAYADARDIARGVDER